LGIAVCQDIPNKTLEICNRKWLLDELGRPVLKFVDEMKSLLLEAAQHGVTIHALDGDPSWVYSDDNEIPSALIQGLGEFNSTQPLKERFAGVHFDIEPHVSARWRDEASRNQLCQNYVRLLKRLLPLAHENGLQFSVDIPFWFDTAEEVNRIEVDGEVSSMIDHVARNVDWFGIMAYRNFATGEDGIIACSEGEINIATRYGKKAMIAVETGTERIDKLDKVTFANRTPDDLDRETGIVHDKFNDSPGYGGLLIHSAEQYRAWKNLTSAQAIPDAPPVP
jgi:hypothetical protein